MIEALVDMDRTALRNEGNQVLLEFVKHLYLELYFTRMGFYLLG